MRFEFSRKALSSVLYRPETTRMRAEKSKSLMSTMTGAVEYNKGRYSFRHWREATNSPETGGGGFCLSFRAGIVMIVSSASS